MHSMHRYLKNVCMYVWVHAVSWQSRYVAFILTRRSSLIRWSSSSLGNVMTGLQSSPKILQNYLFAPVAHLCLWCICALTVALSSLGNFKGIGGCTRTVLQTKLCQKHCCTWNAYLFDKPVVDSSCKTIMGECWKIIALWSHQESHLHFSTELKWTIRINSKCMNNMCMVDNNPLICMLFWTVCHLGNHLYRATFRIFTSPWGSANKVLTPSQSE